MKLVANELELVEQAKRGNITAFQELFEAYRMPVYNFIFRMLGRPHDAEDVLQDVFVKMYQKLATLREPNFFSSWLFRIAKNQTINFVSRHQSKETASLDELDSGVAESLMTVEGELDHDPVKKTEQLEMDDLLQNALNALPENIRACFIFGVSDGYSYKEVAKMLGCSVGNVKSRVFRARMLLSQRLHPHFQGS